MNENQKKVAELIEKYNLTGSAEVRFIDLTSEVGELGKEILEGTDYGKSAFQKTENLESEIGDVLFSLICVANEVGVNLDTAFEHVLNKYENRFSKKGHIGSEE